MEQLHNPPLIAPTPQIAARPAVHPGWLLTERCVNEAPSDPGQEEAMLFAAFSQLMRTAGALDRAATDTLSDLGLTAGAFFAMLELHEVGQAGIAPSELARRLSVARRTATLYVDILTRHGWVERSAHPEDRRMVLAHLTANGESVVAEYGRAYKRRLASLLGELTPLQAERLRQLMALIPVSPDSDHGRDD